MVLCCEVLAVVEIEGVGAGIGWVEMVMKKCDLFSIISINYVRCLFVKT